MRAGMQRSQAVPTNFADVARVELRYMEGPLQKRLCCCQRDVCSGLGKNGRG